MPENDQHTSTRPTVRPIRAAYQRFVGSLPTEVGRRLVVMAWATLVVQVGIVGTGGLVRLTGSGLGCPTWPRCTAESFVPTAEMGVHGLIEFGNRLLTFVLVAVAIVTFLFVVRMRRTRPDLFWLAFAIGLYVPLQAIIGGITVLTNLNPYVVGLHYFASAILVTFAAALLVRTYTTPGPLARVVPGWYAVTTHVTSAAMLVTIVVGILVTGSGPHAGDHGSARNNLDPEFMQHVHAWPAYVLFGLTLILVAASFRMPREQRLPLWTGLLLGVEVLQIVIGLWQARTGLPIALVNAHMVLAVVSAAAMTVVVMKLRAPVSARVAATPTQPDTLQRTS